MAASLRSAMAAEETGLSAKVAKPRPGLRRMRSGLKRSRAWHAGVELVDFFGGIGLGVDDGDADELLGREGGQGVQLAGARGAQLQDQGTDRACCREPIRAP